MYYYDVLVAQVGRWAHDSLTYNSEHLLNRGQVVVVPFGSKRRLGIILSRIAQPQVSTKSIEKSVGTNPLPDASLKLVEWIHEYYASPRGAIVQSLLPASLLRTARKHVPEITKSNGIPFIWPELTTEQTNVLAAINSSTDRTFLLHGQTGSGKTRVYIELAKQSLARGKHALILTPEIALTPQLVEQFERALPGSVFVMHSSLTDTLRRDLWLQMLDGTKPYAIIGARSSLFLPFHELGLIVADEAHEPAYKQEETPKYHTLRVASKLAELNNAQLILGSATPAITDYYIAEQKNIPILTMQQLANQNGTPPPQLLLVDLKDKDEQSDQPYLSRTLLRCIGQTLAEGRQVLLYLNRRGTARLTICNNCGWEALCPRCDIPLVFHHDSYKLICHICGFKQPPALSCPVCQSTELSIKHLGTKSLLESLQHIYPHNNIERFDTDNLKSERLENRYDAAAQGEIDILIGTQLLAKGLDLPKLGLVGVIQADSGLNLPDFSAAERNFQLLYQVLGRVGRGYSPSTAVIQTFNPKSAAIDAASRRDWLSFYEQELSERRQFRFPPFVFLLKLTCSRKTSNGAEKATEKLAAELQAKYLGIELLGPAPAFYEKTHDLYHWQIIIKSNQRKRLADIAHNLPAGWTFDLDPTNLL